MRHLIRGARPWALPLTAILLAGGSWAAGAALAAQPSPRQMRFVISAQFAVGEIVTTYSDPSRLVHAAGRLEPRRLTTVIRYPALGEPSRIDVRGAPAAKGRGPFPLIVFAHGFAATPAIYARLLQAWTRAGYVVAAPAFPLTNADAPGGPHESDLVNQPTDMSFVITHVLRASSAQHGVLSALIDPARIAVAGQSDGGSTALAAGYNVHYLDHRIGAAVILSGAYIPGVTGYAFRASSPPLLAVQGTADTVNAPRSTYRFFAAARPPKFLLSLLGASHLRPYTTQEPQLGVVERVSVAFLDRYLERRPGSRGRLWAAGNVRGISKLSTTIAFG